MCVTGTGKHELEEALGADVAHGAWIAARLDGDLGLNLGGHPNPATDGHLKTGHHG